MNRTVILGCSSLKDYIEQAQKKAGAEYPVIYLDRKYHRDPSEMRQHIITALSELPLEVDTVLVAMGFCGGSWKTVTAPCRIVLPKIDECVSLLLQQTDEVIRDLKKPGHLYVRGKDPGRESFRNIFEHMTKDVDEETKKQYHEDWKSYYHEIDIIDTGINDCRRPEYISTVKRDADWLDAELDFVSGGTYLLEKLFSGNWDEQFVILEAGETI